jgi:adenylate cyclase
MTEKKQFFLVPEKFNSSASSASFEATLLFCDIRGFTSLLERIPAEEAYKFIESFLYEMAAVVVREGGSVNNLTGDGFLAQFGIGLSSKDHALRAVNAAIQMRSHLIAINRETHLRKGATIMMGIGIHSGVVAGGNVRLGARRTFLLIGDAINLAARIEGLTKSFAVDILLSAVSYEMVKDQFQFLAMPSRAVKGKSESVTTYWIPPHVKVSRTYDLEPLP